MSFKKIILLFYIGRLLLGLFVGGIITLMRLYLSETSTRAIMKLPPERQKTSTLKYTLFLIFLTIGSLSWALGAGMQLAT